jgi:hypothetical protein
MVRWLFVCLVAIYSLNARSALAWVETSVRSSVTTVAIAETGSATVTHEWLVRVKGGPLRDIVVDGVDSDAELVDGATIVRASSGQVAGVPIPLTGQREEQALHLEVAYNKGLPAGSYLLRFTYGTNLLERGLIRSAGPFAAVEWQSPTYRDGIDSLKVNFLLPHANSAPHVEQQVLSPNSGADAVQVVSTESGVFLSELTREADSDILTLTRPHVARGERVTWRILVDPSSVGKTATLEQHTAHAPPPSAYVPPQRRPWPYGVAVGFASLFTLLLFFKLRTREYLPLLKLRAHYRLPLLFSLVGLSLWLALVPEWPSLAALLLVAACLLSLTRTNHDPTPVRGPGQWVTVNPETLPYVPPTSARSARWLDVSALPGFLIFLVLMGGSALLGLRMLGVSPYYSATALFYAMAFVPLFFTVGGTKRLSPLGEQLLFLRPILKKVPRSVGSVELIGRFPVGSEVPDEVRLQVQPANPRPGFRGCELALECTQGGFGRVLTPAILFRVDDQSEAHRNLPREGQWSRGRHVEERVVVLRPRLPLRSVTVDLLLSMLKQVTKGRAVRPARKGPKRAEAPAMS